jgi:hypothetical protein
MFVPPAGPGRPAPDAPAAWAEVTRHCAPLQSYSAALRVSGRVGDARVWPIGLETAILGDQSIYLGATAAGQSVFVLAGTGDQATLWLRREQRTVTAAPAAIMEALLGMAVTPADLLGVLTACVARTSSPTSAEHHGGLLAIEAGGVRSYLEQRGGRWQVRAAQTRAFTVEYAPVLNPLPEELWLWPAAGARAPAALHLTVTDAHLNESVPPAVFRVPAGAAAALPMTLEDLKSGVLWKNRAPLERH